MSCQCFILNSVFFGKKIFCLFFQECQQKQSYLFLGLAIYSLIIPCNLFSELLKTFFQGLWCLTPFSTIFQLYHGIFSKILTTFCDYQIDILYCFYLITKSMTTNDNRFSPAWNKTGDFITKNRLTEHCTIQYISDCTIRTQPHLLQFKF